MDAPVVQAGWSNELYTALEYVQKYGTNQDKRTLMQRHNYPDNFYMMLDQLGLIRPSEGADKIWHLEDDWLVDNFKINSIVQASAGANTEMIIEISSTDMFSQNGVTLSYPQERQEIEIPVTGEKVVILEKITASGGSPLTLHRLRVKPIDPTVNLAGKLVANGQYALTAPAWAEGTRGAKPVVSLENYFENYYQITKSKFSTTGTALTQEGPYKLEYSGEGRNVFVIRNTANTEKRHIMDLSSMLLVGQKSKSELQFSEELGHDTPVYRTEGAWVAAKNKGRILPYTQGDFGLDNFGEAAAYLESERIASDMFMFLMGYDLQGAVESSLMEFGATQNGVFNYAGTKFKPEVLDGQSAEDFFTWIGFSGISYRGRRFLFKKLADFNDPKVLGTAGYDYPQSGLIVPYATMNNKGKKSDTPSLGAEYRSLGGYSRKMESTKLGGADMINPTTDLDAKAWHFRSEMGGDWGLCGQWIAVRPTA